MESCEATDAAADARRRTREDAAATAIADRWAAEHLSEAEAAARMQRRDGHTEQRRGGRTHSEACREYLASAAAGGCEAGTRAQLPAARGDEVGTRARAPLLQAARGGETGTRTPLPQEAGGGEARSRTTLLAGGGGKAQAHGESGARAPLPAARGVESGIRTPLLQAAGGDEAGTRAPLPAAREDEAGTRTPLLQAAGGGEAHTRAPLPPAGDEKARAHGGFEPSGETSFRALTRVAQCEFLFLENKLFLTDFTDFKTPAK